MKITKYFPYICLSFVGTILFAYTSTSMASAYIYSDLGGNVMTGHYTIIFFVIGNTLGLPLARTFGGPLGRKTATHMCMLLFIASTFGLALSPTYPVFLALRLSQGFFAGPLLILIVTLGGVLPQQAQREAYCKNVPLLFMLTSTVAICIGGLISYFINWRYLFVLEGLMQAITALLVVCVITEKEYQQNTKPFDFIGYFLFVTTIVSFGIFLVFGHQLNWFSNAIIRASFIVFFIALPTFAMKLRTSKYPIIDLTLLKNKATALGAFQLGNLFFMFYGLLGVNVVWLHLFVSFDPYWISTLLIAMAIAMLIIFYLAAHYKFSFAPLAQVFGFVLLLVSMYLNTHYNSKVNFGRIMIERILAGAGFGFCMPATMHMLVVPNPEDKGIESATLFQLVRTITSGFGLSFFALIFDRRKIFYHYRLGGEQTPFSEITQNFFAWTKNFYFTTDMSRAALDKAVEEQSAALAVNDTFFLMAILCCVSLVAISAYLYFRHKPIAAKEMENYSS